jgi:eukaryotic-like serine/threonine-protein kinase
VQERSSWGFHEGDEIALGRYATRLLGGGRRYEAYLAWDDAMRTLVVVKIVRPGLLDSEGALRGLAGEARALASLSHPAIVRMFDAVLEGDRPHLVLEFLDGPRLSTLARRYRVIVEQLLPLALELCSALHYMHGKKLLQLDVKPRNVVMSGRPRLIDLSVATSFDTVAGFARPVGTDSYMAPEQCDPALFSEIGPWSDVWGLGVTLYEALTRSLPFLPPDRSQDAAPALRYPQLAADPFPLPRDVPLELADALLSCLERRRADRPTAAELATTFEPLVAALPAPRLGLFRPGGRRRPRSDFAAGESILSGASPSPHRLRLSLGSMQESRHRQGGTG